MLINLRVKTLDSQDHEFSVEDDITVRQFKERIQEKTSVEAELQRLIYCGRVMNDEHPLSHYNVNGKVVHLVQRPPPGSTPRAVSGNTPENRPRRHTENGRNNLPIFQVIDGTVLGAMAIPMNTNSGTTQSVTQAMNPSSTLCMNRITVARHMLNCANNIANYLENPERGLNNTDMDILAQQTMESTVFEVGISAVSDSDVPQHDVQHLVQAFQGVVSAAFRQNGLSNIAVDAETGTTQATIPLVFSSTSAPTIEFVANPSGNGSQPSVRVVGSNQSPISINVSNTSAATASAAATTSSESTATGTTSHSQSSSSSENTSSSNTAESASNGENNGQQTTSTQTLAEVVQQMRTVQARMEPFIQQYYDMLQNEPTFEENDTAGRENAQRVFDRVSEALHYFSHAQHAISDLMLDLSLQAPRHLCCRPILVEQSAFVSSGFAVPNIVPLTRRPPTVVSENNNNSNTATNNNMPAGTATARAAGGVATDGATDGVTAAAGVTGATGGATETNATSSTSNAGGNSIWIPMPTPNSNGTNRNAGNNDGQGGDNRSDILRNIASVMQAMINNPMAASADVRVEINQGPQGFEPHIEILQVPQQQTQSTSASTSATNTTSSSSEQSESSQPRVTTATHPTTSTQTRSTARPQIHVTGLPAGQVRNLRPVPIPTMQLPSFDRYLPCNSHHVREPEQRDQTNNGPRRSRVHIQTAPGPSRTTIPAQLASLLTNNRRGSNPTAAVPLLSTTNRSRSAGPANAPTSTASGNALNDAELDTIIPIFGSNQIQLQVRDLANVSPTPSTLNRIRSDLRNYIATNLCFDAGATEENIQSAVNQVLTLINQFWLLLPELNTATNDFDVKASVENLIRKTLPFVLHLIRDDESSEFGTRMLREIIFFSKRLTVILIKTIGRTQAQDFLKKIVEDIFREIAANGEGTSRSALQWLKLHIQAEIQRQIRDIRITTVDVIEFIVIRRQAPTAVGSETADASGIVFAPMETDADEIEPNENANATATNDVPLEDLEPLPTITVGSESWHSSFPEPWLPIITRDISRQRRQSPQRAFSDAYISGMSSKRRKLINGSKPSAIEPNNMLSQGVRHVLQSRAPRIGGASSSSTAAANASNLAALDEAIASNHNIQEPYGSYEQAILNHVQNRIQTDTDFSPERFPNCSQWIRKNK